MVVVAREGVAHCLYEIPCSGCLVLCRCSRAFRHAWRPSSLKGICRLSTRILEECAILTQEGRGAENAVSSDTPQTYRQFCVVPQAAARMQLVVYHSSMMSFEPASRDQQLPKWSARVKSDSRDHSCIPYASFRYRRLSERCEVTR